MNDYEKKVLALYGKAIKKAMEERGMSYSELERRSGVSRTIIYKIVNGDNYEMTSFIRICRHLQIHVEFSLMSSENNIFTMDGDKPSKN